MQGSVHSQLAARCAVSVRQPSQPAGGSVRAAPGGVQPRGDQAGLDIVPPDLGVAVGVLVGTGLRARGVLDGADLHCTRRREGGVGGSRGDL